MRRAVAVLTLVVAMLATAGFADTNNTTGDPSLGPTVQPTWLFSAAPTVQAKFARNAAPAAVRWEKFYDRSGKPLHAGAGDNVDLDSLYFKQYNVTNALYGCPKSQVPNPIPADCRPAFTFLDGSTRVGMDPQGSYIYEASGTNLRRHNTSDGTYTDYTISNGNSCCMTDGSFLYVPVGDVVYRYTLTGTLVSQTTLDITPLQYAFSVANDTVWCGTTSTTLYGYACSKFTGGSITPDATWLMGAGAGSGVIVCWDGSYYYAGWSGFASDTFKRYNADRTVSASGTINIDPRSVMCKSVSPLMIVTTDSASYRVELAETLRTASGGTLNSISTYGVETSAGFPATEWYNLGCRVILEFSGAPVPGNPAEIGDSLAKFVDLGGRVVTAVWADASGNLAGRYVTQYMPFTEQSQTNGPDSMGTVHDPLHPIMDGVSAISVTEYITGNTHSTLRSPNCVCLAEWTSGNRSVVAYLDSANVRLVSVGFVPFKVYSGATGQWAKLLANAILWVWPGTPTVTVTAPATGNVWNVGTSHDITWTEVHGPFTRDSIVYSYDNGVTWNFLDKYNGSRTSYTWNPIPNTPDSNCYVKVFARNATDSALGISGKFEIRVSSGITQPGNNVLPLGFAIYQPYPNPLATGAQIRYALPRPAPVELRIYDVAGALVRRLVTGAQTAGYRSAYWNGSDDRGRRVAPGVYYCRFEAGDFLAVQKLVVRR